MKPQTRKMSLIEKMVETFFAFLLSVLLAPLFFKINGVESDFSQNFNIVICFTILAIVRGYVVRRIFNKIQSINQVRKNNENISKSNI